MATLVNYTCKCLIKLIAEVSGKCFFLLPSPSSDFLQIEAAFSKNWPPVAREGRTYRLLTYILPTYQPVYLPTYLLT